MEKYRHVRYAHRGLHDGGRPENSLSAFRTAMEYGYGIELDVRLSSDGEAVIHHDKSLARSCGVDGLVSDYTAEQLGRMRLAALPEGIPTLRQVLELIDGAVPLLIELKQDVGEGDVTKRFLEVIDGYQGDFIVESFNPGALRKVKKARPDILVGILSCEYTKEKKYEGKLFYKLLQNLNMNFICRPDFIAYEKHGTTIRNLTKIRRKYNTPLLAWTVKSKEEEERLIGGVGFDTVIFEGYRS